MKKRRIYITENNSYINAVFSVEIDAYKNKKFWIKKSEGKKIEEQLPLLRDYFNRTVGFYKIKVYFKPVGKFESKKYKMPYYQIFKKGKVKISYSKVDFVPKSWEKTWEIKYKKEKSRKRTFYVLKRLQEKYNLPEEFLEKAKTNIKKNGWFVWNF